MPSRTQQQQQNAQRQQALSTSSCGWLCTASLPHTCQCWQAGRPGSHIPTSDSTHPVCELMVRVGGGVLCSVFTQQDTLSCTLGTPAVTAYVCHALQVPAYLPPFAALVPAHTPVAAAAVLVAATSSTCTACCCTPCRSCACCSTCCRVLAKLSLILLQACTHKHGSWLSRQVKGQRPGGPAVPQRHSHTTPATLI